jgi:hypothetical protein
MLGPSQTPAISPAFVMRATKGPDRKARIL